MIEVNLLPQELRVKKDKKGAFEPSYLLLGAAGAWALILFLHLVILGIGAVAGIQHTGLYAQWQKLSPQRAELDSLKKHYDALSQDVRISQQLLARRIRWSEKLFKLSAHLTKGVWFEELSVQQKAFMLRGTVVSLDHEEILLINTFIDALKKDAAFFKDFASFEVTSFQTRTLGGYDTLDYVLNATLK